MDEKSQPEPIPVANEALPSSDPPHDPVTPEDHPEAYPEDGPDAPDDHCEPPDGGYGWVVVACGWVNLLLMSGTYNVFGMIYPDLLLTFEAGDVYTVAIITATFFFMFAICVFAGSLCDIFGCRVVALLGNAIAAVGLIMAAFASNFIVLFIGYGVFSGIGFGTLYMASVVLIQHYFTTKRSLAIGLTNSGLGIGMFLYPPLTRYLLAAYAWRGTLLILAAVWLQGMIACSLLRPLPAPPPPSPLSAAKWKGRRAPSLYSSMPMMSGISSSQLSHLGQSYRSLKQHDKYTSQSQLETSYKPLNVISETGDDYCNSRTPKTENGYIGSVSALPPHLNMTSVAPSLAPSVAHSVAPSVAPYHMGTSHASLSHMSATSIPPQHIGTSHTSIAVPSKHIGASHASISHTSATSIPPQHMGASQTSIQQIGASHVSITTLGLPHIGASTVSVNLNLPAKYRRTSHSSISSSIHIPPTQQAHQEELTICSVCHHVLSTLWNMLNLKSLANIYVILFTLIQVCCGAYPMTPVYLPRKALASGLSSAQVAVLISTSGLMDTAGRLLFGALGHRVDFTVLYVVCISGTGLCMMAMAFSDSFWVLLVCVGVGYLFYGGYANMLSATIVDFVGVEKFARAFGFVLFGTAIGFIMAGPVVAHIFAMSASYTVVFVVCGCLQLTGAFLCAFILVLRALHCGTIYKDQIAANGI